MAFKVAMFGWEYPPHVVGGLGVHSAELTKKLVGLGVNVDFYKPKIDGSPIDANIRFKEIILERSVTPDSYALKDFNSAVEEYNAKLKKEFDPSGVSIIHCHDWIAADAALDLSRKHGIPLVSTIHSTELDRSAFFYPQKWIMDIERTLIHGSVKVITVSKHEKEIIRQYYGRGDTKVVYNGFNPLPLVKSDYSRHKRIVFIGRVTAQKGPIFLVRAAKRFCEETGGEVVFCGTGSSDMEVRIEAEKLGIKDKVRLLGYVDNYEMSYWLSQSDAYVLPAVSEPFGMTVLEAMGIGLPTIVSKTTGVAESLFNVLRFDYWDTDELADLMIAVSSSRGLRVTLGMLGRIETSKFSWSKCAEETYAVYREVLAGG
ncbi:MAG: glycosyltransferase family 4 protein [Thermoprotei archaeon]